MNTILITGNGAVNNGWQPVLHALKKIYRLEDINPKFANFIFASIIYKLRWLDTQLGCSQHDIQLKKNLEKKFDETVSDYKKIKNEIINELKKAHESGLISPRKELKFLKYLYLNEETKIITTNWDSTIINSIGNRNDTIFLHGCTSDTLFLPSETIEESYRQRAKLEIPYGKVTGMAISWLQGYGKRIVIYGLSLSPLDVELGLIIADSFSDTSNPKSIIIVDPDYESVKQRLCFLLPHVKPECYHPEDLSEI